MDTSENSTIAKNCPKKGNYLIVLKALRPGEVILREDPALIGPNHANISVCLECCLLEKLEQCPTCDWPMCSECVKSTKKWHSTEECDMLKGKQQLFHAIFPLRLVNEARKNSCIWQQLQLLESHVESRVNSQDWKIFHDEVVPFISGCFKSDQPSIDLVMQCIGIICVNAMSFDVGKKKGRGLFANAALASHQCTMNAIHSIDPKSLRVCFKACKPIKFEEEITISYVPLIIGEPLRTEHILSEWNFCCSCVRCSNQCILSELKCQSCEQGTLRYETFGGEKLTKAWRCSKCHNEMDAKTVKETIHMIHSKLGSITSSQTHPKEMLEKIETFLEYHKNVLGDHHFLRLIALRNLVSLTKNEERKMEICESMLKVIKQVGGKYSEWCGFLYKELARGYAQRYAKVTAMDKGGIFLAMYKGYSLEAKKCQDILDYAD